jgi:uroporphyrinogen-III decarboxylase
LLQLDIPGPSGDPDVSVVLEAEAAIGDTGIVMIDTPDPLCLAAALFDMATYTVVATLEPELFHELLLRFAAILHPNTESIAKALPGRLWRIYGPEYASPPYQSPAAFRDFVVRYDQPMVDSIQRYGGFVRIHSHGNLKEILDDIASMGVDGLDPIEPPAQGNVELSYVRQKYGKQMVLFGNLESTDLENLPTDQFVQKIETALEQGTAGQGRGFVLMPSACPYGRKLPPLALANYKKMVEMVNGATC